MKYFIIAGEASGDMYGANLATSIFDQDSDATIHGWGGDKMIHSGVEISKHIKELAFMGFIEVVMNLRTIKKNFKKCEKEIEEFNPDALILIDYPGFNLRIAEWAKKRGIKIFYYISPQIWAWKKHRIKKIQQFTDKMYVILPFEKEYYGERSIDVEYYGHPLTEVISQYNYDKSIIPVSPNKIIALLPGSRNQEINKMLPVFLETALAFPENTYIIAGAPNKSVRFYKEFIIKNNATELDIHIIVNKTYDILSVADAALVTSGTATLETALFKVPQVVCYKGNKTSYLIAKKLINIEYISLVNLILDKPLVTELIQDEFNTKNLNSELEKILGESRAYILEGYDELDNILGHSNVSTKVAKNIISNLE